VTKKSDKKYESKPQKGETEVGKKTVDKIVDDPAFQFFEQPTVGVRFHIFRKPHEQVIGTIIGDAIYNIRRNRSYPIRLEDNCQGVCECQAGDTIEVFATKHLSKLLRQCVGYKVRIVYVGRRHVYRGYYEKIFRVYKYTKPDQETLIGPKVGTKK